MCNFSTFTVNSCFKENIIDTKLLTASPFCSSNFWKYLNKLLETSIQNTIILNYKLNLHFENVFFFSKFILLF